MVVSWTVIYLAAISILGCSGSSEGPDSAINGSPNPPQGTSLWQGTPSELLKSVFTRYRSATTYRDEGQVRLSYSSDGRHQSEVAPLRVWLDQDTLDVDAYDVRIRQSGTQRGKSLLTAWIVDPASNDFDSQVLQRDVAAGRPKLESLLSDLVLADRLQAGLAGPPPQLEWLLADQPMKRLFEDGHRFEFADRETVEGRVCYVVRVDASGDRYQFWIDQDQSLIRRVDLPLIDLPAGASTSSTMKLSLELSGATFGSPTQSLESASLPTRPRFVTRFLPLPPIEPSRVLGAHPDAFRLKDRGGNVVLDSNSLRHQIHVLGRFVGGAAAVANVALLQNWNSRLPAEFSRRITVTVVVDAAAVNQVPPELTLPIAIDDSEAASRLFSLPPGGLTILDEQGRIVWLQPQVTPDSLVAAGAIIGDLIRGVDVPGRLREQWQQDVRAYHQALNEAAVRNPVGSP